MRLEISSSRRVKDAANGLVNYLLWFVLRGRAYSLVDLGPPPLIFRPNRGPPLIRMSGSATVTAVRLLLICLIDCKY